MHTSSFSCVSFGIRLRSSEDQKSRTTSRFLTSSQLATLLDSSIHPLPNMSATFGIMKRTNSVMGKCFSIKSSATALSRRGIHSSFQQNSCPCCNQMLCIKPKQLLRRYIISLPSCILK